MNAADEKDARMKPLTDLQAYGLEVAIDKSPDGRRLFADDWSTTGLPGCELNTALLVLGYHKRNAELREENRKLRMFISRPGKEATNG